LYRTIEELTAEELRDESERQKSIINEQNHEMDSKDSWEPTYNIISSLNKYTPEEVLFYAAQILAEEMGSKSVAIYTIADRKYARLFSATSLEARRLGNSIKYTEMGELYSDLKDEQIYVNKTNDPKRPALACAVYGGDEMRVILMFWDAADKKHALPPSKRLTVIATLLHKTIVHANHYMSTFRKKNYLEGTNVLNERTFRVLLKAFLTARDKGLTECVLVEFEMGYHDYSAISIQVACKIRQTDYMGVLNGGNFYILLANTDIEGARLVQERFQQLGFKSTIKETTYNTI